MRFDQDRQRFFGFLLLFVLGLFAALLFSSAQTAEAAQALQLQRDAATASALLARGISRETAAAALTETDVTEQGRALLCALGLPAAPLSGSLWHSSARTALLLAVLLSGTLLAGTAVFFRRRQRLYAQAEAVLADYLQGDYSRRLPQDREGSLGQLFAAVGNLSSMLQAQNDVQRQTKDFLKQTIADISHQLKTPLAALNLYQELLQNEAEDPDAVRAFAAKIAAALARMEQLIQSMLKLTRLDSGSIVFDLQPTPLPALAEQAVSELRTRAQQEGKSLCLEGAAEAVLLCDRVWTCEAIGNLVKNALDHTQTGGTVQVRWSQTPGLTRLTVADDGCGIAPEDIHHIFKRFYRSRQAQDHAGAGLGLPLAKSIVEGQGGVLSLQSSPGSGAVFTLSFLTGS